MTYASIKATEGRSSYAQEGGHWYTKTGEPMYEVPNASKPGTMRPTTIKDARKLGLVPSVSTIMKLEAKPQLTNWLVQQGMLACLTLPRIHGEDDTQFIKRALEDSKQQVIKAAERGQFIHGLLEETMEKNFLPTRASPEDAGFVMPVVEWIHRNFDGYTWHAESSFAFELNTMRGMRWFAGKRDLTGTHTTNRPVVLDYKVKDYPANSTKVLAYPEHVTQLAAYGRPYSKEFTAVNIFVSSTAPGVFTPVNWAQPDISSGWDAFEALVSLWYARNDL